MEHAPRPLYDLERADRVARSAIALIERCIELREQQRSLVAAVRANLHHIQSAHLAGSSLLETLRAPPSGLPAARPPAATEAPVAPEHTRPVLSRFHLTAREREVAELLARGRSNGEVAQRLGISKHTARHHTESVFAKLGVHSRAEAGAMIRGWLTPPETGSAA